MIIKEVYIKLKNKQEYKLNIIVSENMNIKMMIDEFLLENPKIKKEKIIEISIRFLIFDF